GGWKRKTLEILLCGALTLTFASMLEYWGWPKSLSVAIGGGVGLIGVDAIRGFAMRLIGLRLGVNEDSKRE
ncbi:TPA: phage holin, lambda family, partial [Escherichia coli]|nr:phage holin, lambda family [Escherichia coli]